MVHRKISTTIYILGITLLFLYLDRFTNAASEHLNTHIIAGDEVRPPGKYGWQGILEVDGIFRCGVILVINNAALTSATCVNNLDASRATLLFGVHDRDSQVEGQPETYNVVGIQVYIEFDGSLGYPGNLAILELEGQVNPDNVYITQISVPDAGRSPEDWLGKNCYASGWGRTASESTSNFLQEVKLDVMSSDDCRSIWTSAGYPESVIDEGMVCADSNTGSVCGADDGGPFVCETDSAGEYELVGITSWTDSACSAEYPSVFTMVSFYNEWIIDKLPTPY